MNKKYGPYNCKVKCAAIIAENENESEGNIVTIHFDNQWLSDDGAAAIEYTIRMNNKLQEVSITLDIVAEQ